MAQIFRCIHCSHLYPAQRASVPPMSRKDPMPIGVCDGADCIAAHVACKRSDSSPNAAQWRDGPRVYWGTCVECRGAVWHMETAMLPGWVCAKCGARWRDRPPAAQVEQE